MNRFTPVICLVLFTACRGSHPDSPLASIRARVASESNVEMLTWRPGWQPMRPADVSVKRVDGNGGGPEVWRARVALDHFHPYTAITDGSSVTPLGGFQAPDPVRASQLLKLSASDAATARRHARTLALLLDPNGGESLMFPADSLGSHGALLESWRRSALPWPADTVLSEQDGWTVRVNTLSRTQSFEGSWSPAVYVFHFGSTGNLLAWSVRRGADILP